MIPRLIIFGILTPLCALAQLQLFSFDGTEERAVSGVYDIGSGAVGDSLDTRFRARNTSTGPVDIRNVAVQGSGFSALNLPSFPQRIASGEAFEFRVRFTPLGLGSFSANLVVNTTTVILRATAIATAVFSKKGGAALPTGTVIDFGTVQKSLSVVLDFQIANRSITPITVNSVTVDGDAFRGPIGITTPLTLDPGAQVLFQIAFEPRSAGARQGLLSIDKRSFPLKATAFDPPFPKPTISIGPQASNSARQPVVSIRLAAASQVAGNGQLRLEFRPGVTGVLDDQAVQFLSTGGRIISLKVKEGDTMASFGEQTEFVFQTGTTAGTLVFTMQLGTYTEIGTVTIAPVAIAIDKTTALRRGSELDVELTGFDNTHSASQISFTFFDQSGRQIEPGAITVDQTANFRQHFANPKFGGMFAMRAIFPVVGNTMEISGVEVELKNSIGPARTQRLQFK